MSSWCRRCWRGARSCAAGRERRRQRSQGTTVSPQDQRIELQAQLSQEDYAKYFAVVGKRQSDSVNFAIYVGAFFLAIPVALAARAMAALETSSPIAIEIAGRFSLF